MEFESRGIQGWASIVRERAAHGCTVAPHNFGFRVAPSCEAPFDGAYPAHTLLQFFLGMAVGFLNGLRGLLEIVEVTELVRHRGEHLRDGTADGQLAVRNTPNDRHLHGLLYRSQQDRQVLLGR
jgi:hypothetical protein